ncbi:unnamed protein product [Durusdinium trenchii]
MTYPASDQPLLVPVAPACSGLFPVSRPSVGRFLLYGNICLDCAMQVQSFPEEDSATRAQSYTKKTGGNCANSCRVLAQLLADTPLSVSSLGVIPDRGNPDANFALSSLERFGIDTSLMQEVKDASGVPTSFVLLSTDTGARTIVSSRCGLKEMDPEHLEHVLAATSDVAWCHFECRQPGVAQMLEMLRRRTPTTRPWVSLEIEKPGLELKAVLPMLQLCDVVFFSSDFIKARAGDLEVQEEAAGGPVQSHVAPRCLRALASQEGNPTQALLICAWGALGAFAFDPRSGQDFFQAAERVQPVDSLGAGDTFNAASLAALALGASVPQMLRCACAVAGRKVAQEGLENLARWVPEDMPWKKR